MQAAPRLAALMIGTWVAAHPVPVRPEERLVAFQIVGDGIPAPLTDRPGDAHRGRAAAANSSQGNCLICHSMPIAEAPVFGDLGPPLDGVGSRLSAAQLRLRLVDAKHINPRSIMPAYYKVDGLQRVAAKYQNRPILSAQECEDIVAYLRTLH